MRNSISALRTEGTAVLTNSRFLINEINSLNQNASFRAKSTQLYKAGFDFILTEATSISNNADYIASNSLSFEVARFVWFWAEVILTLISFALCLLGYYGNNKGFLIGGNILLFMWFMIFFCHLAYGSSEYFVILDICEQVYDVVHLNKLPYNTKGLAYFLSPFSYESKGRIQSQLFNASQTYDSYIYTLQSAKGKIDSAETTIISNYDQLTAFVKANDTYSPLLIDYGEGLQRLATLMQILYDLRYYRHLTKTAQNIEEPLCHQAVNKFPYELCGVMGMIVANLTMLITFLRMLTIRNRIDHDSDQVRKR